MTLADLIVIAVLWCALGLAVAAIVARLLASTHEAEERRDEACQHTRTSMHGPHAFCVDCLRRLGQ